jgi:hypothetical protein
MIYSSPNNNYPLLHAIHKSIRYITIAHYKLTYMPNIIEVYASSLYPLATPLPQLPFQFIYMEVELLPKHNVLTGKTWGTHWELGGHVGNLVFFKFVMLLK